MGLYSDVLYGDGTFYGSDEFGVPPGGPANLNAYQNVIENVVLYWTLNPCTPTIDDFVWTVETDTDPGFASPDLRKYITTDQKITFSDALVTGNTYTVDVDGITVATAFTTDSDTTMAAIAANIQAEPGVLEASVVGNRVIFIRAADLEVPPVFTSSAVTGGASQATTVIGLNRKNISGDIHKGIVVPIYERIQGDTRPMHWRVFGTRGGADSPVTEAVFQIPSAVDEQARDAMLGLLPDVIYKKDPDGNLYKTHDVFGDELDKHHVENIFANNDASTFSIRDLSIEDRFGELTGIRKPGAMNEVDFREIIKQFMIEARNSPAVRAVRNIIRASLCEEPTITPIRDTLDKYVDDSTSTPAVEPPYVDDAGSVPPVEAPTIWGNQELANGVVITVSNPLGTSVTNAFLVNIIRKLVPAHITFYVTGI